LVLQGNYAQDNNNVAVFKSGANTGCCVRTVPGIGCKQDEFCSFSQGLFFASPHAWPVATVTVGGYVYTEAEGRLSGIALMQEELKILKRIYTSSCFEIKRYCK
jgi:hypothetical protein